MSAETISAEYRALSKAMEEAAKKQASCRKNLLPLLKVLAWRLTKKLPMGPFSVDSSKEVYAWELGYRGLINVTQDGLKTRAVFLIKGSSSSTFLSSPDVESPEVPYSLEAFDNWCQQVLDRIPQWILEKM